MMVGSQTCNRLPSLAEGLTRSHLLALAHGWKFFLAIVYTGYGTVLFRASQVLTFVNSGALPSLFTKGLRPVKLLKACLTLHVKFFGS